MTPAAIDAPGAAPPTGEGPHPPARPAPSGPRVGFWLALLLLLVPVFYPLLYFRPFSVAARSGWGLWLGLVLFVKVFGFSEPVINLTEIETELRRTEAEQAQPQQPPGADAPQPAAPAAPTVRETFVQEENAPPPEPPLVDYLRELGGGLLGRRIDDYAVEGEAIRIAFKETAYYLNDEPALAAESLGMGLSLCFGRDFRTVTLDFVLGGRPVRVQMTRATLADFLGMDEAALRTALATRPGQQALAAREQAPARLAAFFQRFAVYR